MRLRVKIASTSRGIRRTKAALKRPQVRQDIARAGAGVILKAAQAAAPVGTSAVKRYAPRSIKGKANRPSRLLKVTQPGNLKASLDTRPTSFGIAVGPRMMGQGTTATYAAAVHARDPFLVLAHRRAGDNARRLMIQKLSRVVKSLDV